MLQATNLERSVTELRQEAQELVLLKAAMDAFQS